MPIHQGALLAAHIDEATGWELTISHWITSIAETFEVIGTGCAALRWLATLTQASNFVGSKPAYRMERRMTLGEGGPSAATIEVARPLPPKSRAWSGRC
jgi:hypothetical protein